MRVLSNISKRVLEDYFSAENLQLERKLTVLFTYCFLIWYPVACIAGPRKNGRAKGRETRVSPSRASSFLRPTSKRLLRMLGTQISCRQNVTFLSGYIID